MTKPIKIAVAITGASGSIYAKAVLETLVQLKNGVGEVSVVMSDNARAVWEYELGDTAFNSFPFRRFEKMDFNAPFASGSGGYDALLICPCSMGTLGRIANGVSNDLIARAADVMLKERKKLVLVVRETPYNLIHLRNMTQVTEAGGIICPATPSFYSKPIDFYSLAKTVTDRALALCGIEVSGFSWGN